jgi:hypothetical protein
MGKIDVELMGKKMKHINKGAYWFGIIGRLSIAFGAIELLGGFFQFIGWFFIHRQDPYTARGLSLIISSIPVLINGWLFLLARDSFEAIAYLIKESEGTV